MLCSQLAVEKLKNRMVLLTILRCIKFLSCQALAFCLDGDEANGNFVQMLIEENLSITDWLLRKSMKHTSHQIQNELLRLIAAEMTTFKYMFGNVLAEKILRHTDNLRHIDNLSKMLQTPSCSAATG